MPGEQDGTQTVDKARFDGLMAAHQKALARVRELEAAGQAGGSSDSDDSDMAQDQRQEQKAAMQRMTADALADAGDSQPFEGYEEGGQYVYEGGKFVPFEPPTPGRHNESRVASELWGRTIEERTKSVRDESAGYPI